MNSISETLIHFLGRKEKHVPKAQMAIFKSIVLEGLRCAPIEIGFGTSGVIAADAICFTDIPLNFCDVHTGIYGKFGIGFKKSFVKRVGGNPTRYYVDYPVAFRPDNQVVGARGLISANLGYIVSSLSSLDKILKSNGFTGLHDQSGTEIYKASEIQLYANILRQLLSFEKPTGDLGPARDEHENTDTYYQEREWRIVPFQGAITAGKVVPKSHGTFVPFNRDDVRVVIVPNDDLKEEISEWFASLKSHEDTRLTEFGKHPPSVLNYEELKFF